MNNTYFGATHYDFHLDMKLYYTISRIFQEMSLSELETLHHLCELERTQILDICCQKIDQILKTTKEIYHGITHVRKKCHHYMYLRTKDVTRESPFSTKIKYILLTRFLEEHIFGIQPSHVDLKIATMM